MLEDSVDFPTPPFPEVTTITLVFEVECILFVKETRRFACVEILLNNTLT